MAVDPAMVGFQVVDNLQNTLLNYVMQNRRMQSQERQFNTQMNMEQNRLNEQIRRFDLKEDRLNKAEKQQMNLLKANRAMLDQEMSIRKQRQLQMDFDKSKTEYESNPLVRLGLFPDFKEKTGIERPVVSDRKLPSFYDYMPSFGIDNLFSPTQDDLLLNARLQGLIQKGKE
tara:strand:+ start:43 stop:558 length:516 start_codon:yes stop_codon:yes gene_type:complete